MLLDDSKMADKSEKPKETRWFFKDEMVEDLIEVLGPVVEKSD